MPITLTIADAGTGTGGTATISGSTAGTTNLLRYAAVTGSLGSVSFTDGSSRLGDGTIPFTTPAVGHYWFVVQNTNGATISISDFVYQRLTDTTDSVRLQCRDAIVARLKLLALTSIGNRVIGRPYYDEQNLSFPVALVTFQETPDSYEQGTNERDDVGYPIQIFLLDTSGLGPDAPEDKYTLWRQQAERCFRNQALAAVSGIYTCRVEPAILFDKELGKYQRVVSAFTVRCISREARGFGA